MLLRWVVAEAPTNLQDMVERNMHKRTLRLSDMPLLKILCFKNMKLVARMIAYAVASLWKSFPAKKCAADDIDGSKSLLKTKLSKLAHFSTFCNKF